MTLHNSSIDLSIYTPGHSKKQPMLTDILPRHIFWKSKHRIGCVRHSKQMQLFFGEVSDVKIA